MDESKVPLTGLKNCSPSELGQRPIAIIGILWALNLFNEVSPICTRRTAAKPKGLNKTLRSGF